MKNYTMKTIKEINREKSKQKTVQVSAVKDNDEFTINDVKYMVQSLQNKHKNDKILVRGLADSWKTLKPTDGDLMTDGEIEEYLNNRVKNTNKFKSFGQLQFTLISLKK